MHGDYYKNKRFDDDWIETLARFTVCIILALIIGFIINHKTAAAPRRGSEEVVQGTEPEEGTEAFSFDFYRPDRVKEAVTIFGCFLFSVIIVFASAFGWKDAEKNE